MDSIVPVPVSVSVPVKEESIDSINKLIKSIKSKIENKIHELAKTKNVKQH